MNSSLTDLLDFQSRALALRSERQRVLSSNIANADTPGYVARDLDFNAALKRAAGSGAGTMATTQGGHMKGAGAGGDGSAADLVYAARTQMSLDQNTVDLDRERASFADNTIRYEATLSFINDRIKTMMSAITGQ